MDWSVPLRASWSRTRFGLCALAAVHLSSAVCAQVPPRALLPDDVLVVVETDDAGQAVSAMIDTLGAVPQDLPETVRTEIALGLTAIRLALGETPSVLGKQLAQGGMALGLRMGATGTPEALLVLRPGDSKAARAFLARSGDAWKVVERGEFLLAGSTGAARDAMLRMERAPHGRWASWPDAAPMVPVANSAGDPPNATAAAPATDAHTIAAVAAAPVRAYVDLAALRKLGGNQGVAAMPGGGRFALAPLLPALLAADRATLQLGTGSELSVTLRMPMAHSEPARAPWSLLQPHGLAPRAIVAPPADALMVLALDRSLRALLHEPARFLSEQDATAAQAFLSVADQLDGPRSSFVEDLLGGIVEPVVVCVLPPTPPSESDPPRLWLPGVAMVAALRDAKHEAVLTRTAQVILLIGNTERAQRHEMAYVVRTVRDEGDGVHGITATLPEWRRKEPPPTEYGVEPTLLFGHGHVALATTQAAARAMLAQAKDGARMQLHGDLVELRGPSTAAAIQQSLQPLLLARMLDEGDTEREAGLFYDVLTGMLRALRRAALEVSVTEDAATVRLRMVRQ